MEKAGATDLSRVELARPGCSWNMGGGVAGKWKRSDGRKFVVYSM